MNCKPSLDSHRRDLIKYAALTNTSILDLRNNLVDSYDNPVFDFPVFCSTKYLNRVALSNAKRVLDTFRRSHNNGKSKSKYQPLATGYSVYHYFHQAPQSNVRFKDVSRDLYLSQFYPPPPDNSEGKNMVGFSHLNNVRHQGPGFGSPSASTLRSFPSINKATGFHHAPATSAALPSLATRVEVRTESSEPSLTQTFQFNVNVHGQTCDYYTKMEFGQNGLSYAGFPGGGGIEAFYGSNLITVNDVKHNALLLNVSTSLPVNNAMPFTTVAEVVSPDTVIVPIISGLNPELADKMMDQLSCEEHRIGTKLDNVFDVLRAFKAAAQARGFTTKKLAITFKGLPHQLSQQGMLQDDVTLKVNPRGLTATVCSGQFSCKDNLDDEGGLVYFNGTGNFYVVPVVAPDLQLVTKEVPKDHLQLMLEKRKARNSKNRKEDSEVRSLNSEFGNMDLKSISAASLSPCNPHQGTPLSSISHSASNRFRELMNAKFKKFVKANRMLKGHNLVFVEGDGNCAPRTMAVLMYGSEGLWSQVKALVADFSLKNFQELVKMIGLSDDEIIKMATDGSWQSEVFFKVAAMRFEVDIAVFGYGGEHKLYQALNGAKNELKVFFWNGHFCPIVQHPSLNRHHKSHLKYLDHDDEVSSEDERPTNTKSKRTKMPKHSTRRKPVNKYPKQKYTKQSKRSVHKYASSSSSETESSDESESSNKFKNSDSESSNGTSTSSGSESSDKSEISDVSEPKAKTKDKTKHKSEESEPEESEPEESEPEESEPEESEPKESKPGESEPEGYEPEASEPETAKLKATELEASESVARKESNTKTKGFNYSDSKTPTSTSKPTSSASILKSTLPPSTSKPSLTTPTKLVSALKTPTGSAGKRISDTFVSFFGGLTTTTSDDRMSDENGSDTIEFAYADEHSAKQATEEVKVEEASVVEEVSASGRKTPKKDEAVVDDNDDTSEEEDAPEKTIIRKKKKKTVPMDSDEEDARRMKKKIGAKKTIAGYDFESDAQKKKKRVKKIMVVVDNDDENSSKKPKSKKKNKEIVPTRRSHRQSEKRTKK